MRSFHLLWVVILARLVELRHRALREVAPLGHGPLVVALVIIACSSVLASEIREFDIKTLERLGNELTRVSQTPDRGATIPERKRAKQTAIAALKGKLFDIHYDYVVLDDPDGSGLVVYALASTGKPNEFVLAGHFRVTVSADGAKAERVDAQPRGVPGGC